MRDIDRSIRCFLNDMRLDFGSGIPKFLHGSKGLRDENPRVLYSGPYWDDDEIAAIIRSVLMGKWISAGDSVSEFESKFASKFDQRYATMVNSGSSANLVMISALKKYYGWSDGDEIILSSVGFPTTLNPIIQNNLTPIFVDINMGDLNWDLNEISNKITERTVAVFSSPVLGNMYDLDKLIDICGDKTKIVGDVCDSLGTMWRDKNIQTYFCASSHSFYPAHHITTGEGGLVTTDDRELHKIIKSMVSWGRDCHCVGEKNMLPDGGCGKRFSKWLSEYGYDNVVDHKYVFSNIGYNLKPLDLQGEVGLSQLGKFDGIVEKRRHNKGAVQALFEKRVKGVRIPNELGLSETSWFGVPVVCDNNQIKESLVAHLEFNGIQTRNYFTGNVLFHPAYCHLDSYDKYPNANKVLDCVFFVGCCPNYNSDVLSYIDEVLEKYNNAK